MAAGLAGMLLLASAFAAQAQPQQDPDWPCIQRLVPTLAAGQIWNGPSIEEVGDRWADDRDVVGVVNSVTSRRVSIEEAVDSAKAFADGLEPGEQDRLTLLFAGIFQRINESRTDAITAIKRYMRAQRGMVDALSAEVSELEQMQQDPAANAARIEDLTASIEISRRIFADRRRALRPLCEQPVLLEERLGALARTIMAHLG